MYIFFNLAIPTYNDWSDSGAAEGGGGDVWALKYFRPKIGKVAIRIFLS
jgi:hypothetical protein